MRRSATQVDSKGKRTPEGVSAVSRPVSGILSSGPLRVTGWVTIHLCGLPGESDGPPFPDLALLRVGFAEPPGSPRALVRSYRTVSPSPVPTAETAGHRRSVLCGTFLRVAPTGR